jgi:hypothetical protein
MRLAAICVALVAIGCANPAGTDAPFVSGSRLRAIVDDGGEGATVFVGWQDTTLSLDCAFARAADGELRCLPLPHASASLTSGDIVYLDAECTMPARVATGSETPPRMFPGPAREPADACGDVRSPIFERGEPLPIEGRFLFYDYDGCQPFGAAFDATYQLFALGAEVSADTFVRASVRDEARSDRIAAHVAVADDGARQTLGLLDRREGNDCTVVSWLAPDRCVPNVVAWVVGDFADAACTMPSAYSSDFAPLSGGGGECAPAPVLAIDPYTECSPRFYALEGEVPTAYRGDPCAVSDASGHVNWLVGAELPADALPAVEIGGGSGSGRLLARASAAENGRLLVQEGDFLDGETGEPCRPGDLCDGSRRCIPTNLASVAEAERRFADAACTQALVSVWVGGCTRPSSFVRVYGALACLGEEEIHRVGERTDATTSFMRDASSACVAAAPLEADTALYAIGPVVPASTLAPVERRIE